MADVVRDLLNYRQESPGTPDRGTVASAISGLSKLDWNFHSPPWRHLLLIPEGEEMSSWRIRSEERKQAQNLAKRIVKWQIGLDELAEDEVAELREDWELMLLPALVPEKINELWAAIEEGAIR